MSYVITRDEIQTDGTRFVNIEVTDEFGVYNYGRWITVEQSNSIIADPSNLTKITDSMEVSARANKLSEVPVTNPNVYTKLSIRRAMRQLGNENILDALLTNETFAKDWNDAIEIDLTDEMVVMALSSVNVDIESIKMTITK